MKACVGCRARSGVQAAEFAFQATKDGETCTLITTVGPYCAYCKSGFERVLEHGIGPALFHLLTAPFRRTGYECQIANVQYRFVPYEEQDGPIGHTHADYIRRAKKAHLN